jgi:uncharacterized membrane-anchored protein YitT (DUF2179 family)
MRPEPMALKRRPIEDPPGRFRETMFDKALRTARNLGLILAGSVVFAVGLQAILVPNEFLSGGVVGVALIIQYLAPSLPMGPVYFVLNIPLLILGWFTVSRSFMLYSIAGMFLFSIACTVVIPPPFTVDDPILAALLAGVICGVGSGLILRSIGSAGGLDILAVYLNRRFGLRLGTVFFGVNALVLGMGAYLHDLDKALYSIVFVYASGRVMDGIMAGFNRRKLIYVISDKSVEIAEMILRRVNRGVTLLHGRGAFSEREKDVILTITTMTELPRLKELIFGTDPGAFVIVNDTLEVLGNRHGKLKVY